MARSRSIKPGFFTNDDLAELPFEFRLLFIGLWTLADREGRLLDRHKKIKMEIFPADEVDCEAGLSQLSSKGFLVRYEVSGVRYIQISNWKKHQSPHIKETHSSIPEPAPEIPVPAPEIPERAHLTPSSLTPDSGLLTPCTHYARDPGADAEGFSKVRAAYPTFSGRQDWITVEHHCRIRVEGDGLTWAQLIDAASRYRVYCDAGGVSSPKFVMNPVNFFSAADKPWLQAWTPPPSKAQMRQDKNLEVSMQWLAEQEAKDAAH